MAPLWPNWLSLTGGGAPRPLAEDGYAGVLNFSTVPLRAQRTTRLATGKGNPMLRRLLLTATFLIAAPALAQTPAAPSDNTRRAPTIAAVIDACQGDLKAFCGEEPVETSRLSQCIQRNREKVSPACQAVWPSAAEPQQARNTDRRSSRREARQACAADLRSFCDGKRGREARECLGDNREKLSQDCRTALNDSRGGRRERRAGGRQQDQAEDDEF